MSAAAMVEDAPAQTRFNPPHLVLLDVRLQGMYELHVARNLRQGPSV